MCCCDEDVIALLCVGIPAIVYAVLVGFPERKPNVVGKALFCKEKGTIIKHCPKLTDTDVGKMFIFIMVIAIIFIIYGIVVGILRCLLCCCSGCCGCDCFLKYAYRIGVGVGLPALIDFLTYLISAAVASEKGWLNSATSENGAFNYAIGGYSGISMLSLASGWVFTIVIGSFFIQKDSCWLKFLGLILGCVVAFLIIAIIVPCDPRNLYSVINSVHSKKAPWAGVVLGLVNVAVFTGMYAAALCCLDGCCCCK